MKLITLGTSHGDPTPSRFNSSTLLIIGDACYLIDAGGAANVLLIRRGIPMASIRQVFVTHMHEDHIGGLPGVIKSRVRYPVPGQHTRIWLPEEAGIPAVRGFMAATHRDRWTPDLLDFGVVTEGSFFEDELLRVTAFRTRHMENEGLNFPSFGFLLEAEGKRIVYTGDLKYDFCDFPYHLFDRPAVCVSECTHFPFADAVPKLAKLPILRLICNHVPNALQDEAGEEKFRQLTAGLPFPALLAHDGDEFSI